MVVAWSVLAHAQIYTVLVIDRLLWVLMYYCYNQTLVSVPPSHFEAHGDDGKFYCCHSETCEH